MTTIALYILCIAVAAFFAAAEYAYSALNPLRLRHMAEEKKGLYRLTLRNHNDGEATLVANLLGSNLAAIAAGSLSTFFVVKLWDPAFAWVATLVTTILLVFFAEITPKILANARAIATAKRVAIPLRIWMILIFIPLIIFRALLRLFNRIWKKGRVPSVTEEDIEVYLEKAEDEGTVDEDTVELLQSALDFDDMAAYDILTHRVDTLAVDLNDSREELLRKAFASPYTRMPVYRGTPDNVVGILHLNRLFRALTENENTPIAPLLMQPVFVHKTMPLPDVLAVMRRRKCHMVIVTDEYGGTMGIVTMEDLIEELVGDIWDETDQIEEEIREIKPGTFEVDGDMRLEDFCEYFEKDIEDVDEDEENETVGGWAVSALGGYPKVMERFSYENLTLSILRREKHRVTRLRVEVDANWEAEEETDSLYD
ncbi:MAG: hemolysin family protein [Clostridiales bacterium]|nr:hemolysin family protein [Clostridiales bacterium]